jgi:murein DD-endopeptidase MepM/ murein hydrolase activator NlpD
MQSRLTRRSTIALALGAALGSRGGGISAQADTPDWIVDPIGWPNRIPGEGFQIGHGFACENTWFSAGWWHTGEDWYSSQGDSSGASVYAVAAGNVVYADFNYPGRVVIIEHESDLYSMYGHLDPESLTIKTGQTVTAGRQLGVLLKQAPVEGPGQAPSHLHFEMRTFLTHDDVNGATPQHGVNCGFQCPPGPGYWPISASKHPAEIGWRNPTHGRLAQLAEERPDDLRLVVNPAFEDGVISLFVRPDEASRITGEIDLNDDSQVALLDLRAADPNSTETSAEAYDAWFRVRVGDDRAGWVRAAIASDRETGSDGRPSAVDVPFLIVTASDT